MSDNSWTPIPFYDPHFHLWACCDSKEAEAKFPNPKEREAQCVHSIKTLGGPGEKFPIYTASDYERHMDEGCSVPKGADAGEATVPWAKHVGGVFVEALPNDERSVEELCWVVKEIGTSKRQYQLVGRANFGKLAPSTAQAPWCSEAQKQFTPLGAKCTLRGVRQILNHEPSWPFVTCDLLSNDDWLGHVSNALKETCADTGVLRIPVFELHLNPHQLQAGVEKLVIPNPQTNFVLNHLGTKRPEDDDEKFWASIQALAKCRNAYVKISDPPYASKTKAESWDSDPEVLKLVRDLIAIFGPDRCMVASNFPVSHWTGAPPQRLFRWLQHQLFAAESGYSRAQVEDMMAGTAMRVYSS